LIAFARTILADPPILILDEATSSVDTRTEELIQQALKRLLMDHAAVVNAHRLSTVRSAHLVLVIEGGQIVERGIHAELLAKRAATPSCMSGSSGRAIPRPLPSTLNQAQESSRPLEKGTHM
jgi:ABC-type multidrug transport system fused ATPase/permease subunit